MNKLIKVALLQTKCTIDKSRNLQIIQEAFKEAAKNQAKICVLGEIVNSPYSKDYMTKYAESFQDSETLNLFKKLSKQYQVYTICSIPQRSNEKHLYNTGIAVSPQGELVAKMRKLHMFDIDIPGKITYKESETFQPGDEPCVFDTEYGKIGLCICYDIRFPELSLLMRQRGARILVYPGSFNQTTGPLHWELLVRSRALDNQCYAIGASTAQSKDHPELYQSWGHSMGVDPMGRVLVACDENPDIKYFDINLDYIDEARQQIPTSKQKRLDIYRLEDLKKNDK